MQKIQLEVTLEQADAISQALDIGSRLALGQLEEIAGLIRTGVIPTRSSLQGAERQAADLELFEQAEALLKQLKCLLGLQPGASLGRGNADLHVFGRRTYEVMKVLDKTLAEIRNPNPSFRGVNYDGLGPRYTQDPVPVARVTSD